MASSKSEARRLIAQGAVHLNGRKISSIEEEIEPGTLQVGKRKKTLIIRNFAYLHVSGSTGGYLNINLKTLQEKPSEQQLHAAIADGVADAIQWMSNKNYIDITASVNSKELVTTILALLNKNLINYEIGHDGSIDLDLMANAYINGTEEAFRYANLQNAALVQIKQVDKTDQWLQSLECPKCGNTTLRFAYNTGADPKKLSNANGVCDSYGCGFKFNHLIK